MMAMLHYQLYHGQQDHHMSILEHQYYGDAGTAGEAKDSVILIVGTENDTQIIVEPPPLSQVPSWHSSCPCTI